MTRRPLALAFAALLVVVAGLAVLGVLLGMRAYAAEQAETRRQAILHAARQQAVNLTSLNYKTLDADLQRILTGSTGEVEQKFAEQSELMHELLPKSKVVSDGNVITAGIVSADKDSAKVLVVADSTVKNSDTPKGAVRHYRIWMGLTRDGGRWLVSDLGFSQRGFAQ